MSLSSTASTSRRAVPAGEISAAIQTLLSMTSLSAFIREQLVQRALGHALSGRVFAGALHGLAQSLARHTLPTGVALCGNHHYRGAAVARNADGLALGGLQHCAESVFCFQGGNAFHGS